MSGMLKMSTVCSVLLIGLRGCLATAAGGTDAADRSAVPGDVTLPLTVFEVDWSNQAPGRAPLRVGKARLEALSTSPWDALPCRMYSRLDFVTRERTALVMDGALGLDERPVVFTAPEASQPHWGPRMYFNVPPPVAEAGRRWRVSLDVSMANVTKLGGIALPGITQVTFLEDGTLQLGKTELARYRPAVPLHIEWIVDVAGRTCTARVDGGEPVTVVWRDERAAVFRGIRLDGLLPGGHARAPGQLAFDNIRIELLE